MATGAPRSDDSRFLPTGDPRGRLAPGRCRTPTWGANGGIRACRGLPPGGSAWIARARRAEPRAVWSGRAGRPGHNPERAERPGRNLQPAVGVQPAEPERPRVRDQHHPEADDQQQRRRPAGPCLGKTGDPGLTARSRRRLGRARVTTRTPDARAGTYSPLYACSPLNQSDPEYVTSTIPNPTTSSSAAGRPAHERWFRACR